MWFWNHILKKSTPWSWLFLVPHHNIPVSHNVPWTCHEKVQIKHALVMVLNNELMGLMMAERINIWYPLRKSRFHILVWKILWNISLERKLCGYFQSSVHSLRRLYKLNCLQILKTTNKTSVGEEIYFLCAWLKASWETWNVVTTSTFHKRGGAKKKPPNPPHIFLIQMRG